MMGAVVEGAPVAATRAPRRNLAIGPWLRRTLIRLGVSALAIGAGIALWAVLSLRYSDALLPSPAMTWDAAVELWRSGRLWDSIWASSKRILWGWGLGVLVGVPAGLLMGRFRWVRTLLDPYVEFFRFIPPIAFTSLAVVWLGIGESSKVILIFYTSVFIVTLSTLAGVLAVNPQQLRAAASLGAGRFRILRSVIFPATIPYIVTGARMAMGNSFLTIVSAEIVNATSGLGQMIWTARNYGRTDWVFVGIIVLGILGFLFDRVLRMLARVLLKRYQVNV